MCEGLVHRLYAAALRIYPADYRQRFCHEMHAAFCAAADDRRASGVFAQFELVCVEIAALVVSATREWAVKAISDPIARARALPDCSRMRPVGITREEWASGLDYVP